MQQTSTNDHTTEDEHTQSFIRSIVFKNQPKMSMALRFANRQAANDSLIRSIISATQPKMSRALRLANQQSANDFLIQSIISAHPPKMSRDIQDDETCLTSAAKIGHRIWFAPDSKFFGVYWRNKSNSLCGFPTAQGLDYMTFQKKNRHHQSVAPKTKNVTLHFSLDTLTYNKYETIIFMADLVGLRDLPLVDDHLLGMQVHVGPQVVTPSTYFIEISKDDWVPTMTSGGTGGETMKREMKNEERTGRTTSRLLIFKT